MSDFLEYCKCEECPLKGSIQIPGEGPDQAELVFVGKAPARDEIRSTRGKVIDDNGHPSMKLGQVRGRPMVGRSGNLLKIVAKKKKIEDYHITNSLLCMIPDDLSGSELKKAMACCKERLFEEIIGRKPKMIVTLGNVALEALTGVEYQITQIEGRVIDGIIAPILPISHPAKLFRRPYEFFDFIESMGTVKKYFNGTYQQAGTPKTVIVDENNIGEVCQILENANKVAVDLETTKKGFYPYGADPDEIRCIALAVDEKTAYIVPGKSSTYYPPHPDYSEHPSLKYVLNRANCIFHNSTFDAGFMRKIGYKPHIFCDTLIAHYMIDEREEKVHDLKRLAKKYLGADDWEADIRKFLPTKNASYDHIPDDRLYVYASHDVCYTYQLSEGYRLRQMAQKFPVYDSLLIPCANMFSEIRHEGFPIDVGYLMDLDEILDKELDQALEELRSIVGYHLNPGSAQEVAHYLYDELKLPIDPKKGRTTNKKHLESAYQGVPVIDKIIECKHLAKLRGTYVIGVANLTDMEFRIHPQTKLHGAVTGRISTKDPSVMNVTKKGGVKKLYIPRKDHFLVEADQKQMELRCYAAIANDRRLGQLIQESLTDSTKDPHFMVASEASRKTGRTISRGIAKTVVFGRLYGRGLDSIMRALRLDKASAQALVSSVDSLFPTIPAYNKRIREEIHSRGYLESYFKRRRRFGLITDEFKSEWYRQGANFEVQSMASDVNLYCMLHIYQMRQKLGVTPMWPVHDSVVMDVPSLEGIPELRREMESFCMDLTGHVVPFKVEVKAGKNWGDAEDIPE